jgi:hypothetical protein
MYTKSLEVISSGNVFEEQLRSPLPHFGWKLLSYFPLPQYKAYIIIQTFAFDVGKTRKQEFGHLFKYTKMLNPKLDSSS